MTDCMCVLLGRVVKPKFESHGSISAVVIERGVCEAVCMCVTRAAAHHELAIVMLVHESTCLKQMLSLPAAPDHHKHTLPLVFHAAWPGPHGCGIRGVCVCVWFVVEAQARACMPGLIVVGLHESCCLTAPTTHGVRPVTSHLICFPRH